MTPSRPILESEEKILKSELEEMYMHTDVALDKAMKSLREYDVDLAGQVISEDSQINRLQQTIERDSLRTIALQQPVASDLRKLMTDIFVAMELERIADHAAAIAEIVLKLEAAPAARHLQPVLEMADKCKSMLKTVMLAYHETDELLARNAAGIDDEIDSCEQAFNDIIFHELRTSTEHSIACTYLLWISHNLERVGDRATNIAERVVYLTSNETPELNS